MPALFAISAVVLSYLLGSVPSGVLATRLITRREVLNFGSGRTGATNVYRAAGPLGLALTSVSDIFKGILAVWIARALMVLAVVFGADPSLGDWIEALAGISVIVGHNWSVFLGFRGGAGTATSVGVLAAMNLYAAIAVAIVGLTAIALSRMASIGSITIALAMGPALAVSAAIGVTPWAFVLFGIVGGACTTYALLPNIRRILSGRERRLKLNH